MSNHQTLSKAERLEKVKEKLIPTAKESQNVVKEDLVIQFADHFREQYEQLFPLRAALLLSPHNEFGCQVCANKNIFDMTI